MTDTRNIDGQTLLDFFGARRSVRRFTQDDVPRATLKRLLETAITAPSSTNRQPWRFEVVLNGAKRQSIVEAVRARVEAIDAVIANSHHAEDYGRYGDFFFEPLEAARVIIIPLFREYPDLLAQLIRSGGGDAAALQTPDSMQTERCATSAAIMNFLHGAHAEGLGACWMAGPMVAETDIREILGVKNPWRMLGAVALGVASERPEPKPRKSIERVVQFHEELDDVGN